MCALLGFAGAQGTGASAPLLLPSGVAFDAQGNLYIAEAGRHVVRRLTPAGDVTTVAGTGTQGYGGDGGPASAALLDSPQGLAVSGESLYIADTHNHRVRRVDLTSGEITTVAGGSSAGLTGDGGPASAALLDRPVALAVDGKGNLWIADAGSHRIRRMDAATGVMTTVAGTGAQGYAGDGAAASAALLDSPGGLAVDAAGNLYVADTHNQRVRRVDVASGTITTVAGTGAFGYAGDSGDAASARLALPRGLSVDAQGNVYFADAGNQRVRRIDAATGVITTAAGSGAQGFAGDKGGATEAELDAPSAVGISPAGQLAVADAGNQRVRQVAGDSIQTIAGPGAIITSVLTIRGEASVSYGSGELTATLSGGDAGGMIRFLDEFEGGTNVVATIPVESGAATLDTSHLAAGQHVITASYGGDSTHPAVESTGFSLTVTRARTATALSATTGILVTAAGADAGQPVLFTVHVTSATTGTPRGTVILFDGGTLLAAGNATGAGDVTFSTSALSSGPHSLTAAYSGDQNFEPSTSTTLLFTVGTPPAGNADFTLAPSGATTQTIDSGDSASFSFSVQMTGELSSPITLSASGLPDLAKASFNPGSITPGVSSATFTMTVATPKTTALASHRGAVVWALTVPFTALLLRRRRKMVSRRYDVVLFCLPLALLSGCGDRVRVGGDAVGATKSYTITVTGTATNADGSAVRHTAEVTLVLQSLS